MKSLQTNHQYPLQGINKGFASVVWRSGAVAIVEAYDTKYLLPIQTTKDGVEFIELGFCCGIQADVEI